MTIKNQSTSRPKRKPKPAKGHGEEISIRIDIKKYPEVVELLKCRTREEFERKYKIKLSDLDIPDGKKDIPWRGFKHRLVAILGHIARRKDQKWDEHSLH